MPQSINAVYLGMLREPNLSPEHQKRIYKYAKARGEKELLSGLLRHPNLIEEIDQEFAKVEDFRVRAEWIKRPNRDPAVVREVLSSEKTITVLASLAKLELPKEAYMPLAERDSSKIASNLLLNPAVPKAARIKAAATWGRTSRLTNGEKISEAVSTFLKNDPDLIEAAFEATDSSVLLAGLASSPNISKKMLDKAVIAAIDEIKRQALTEEPSASLYSMPYRYPGLRYNAVVYPSFNAIYRLSENPLLEDTHIKQVTEALLDRTFANGLKTSRREVFQAQAKAVVSSFTYNQNTRATRRKELKDNKNSPLKAAFVDAIRNRTNASAVFAVLSHPDSTVEMAVEAAKHLYSAPSAKMISQTRQELLVAFFANSPYNLTDRVLSAFPHPAEAVVEILRYKGSLPNRSALYRQLLNSSYITLEALLEFPVNSLAYSKMPLYVHQVYGRALLEAFGDSDEAWDVFESLSDEFEGTFAELLETAGSLAQ